MSHAPLTASPAVMAAIPDCGPEPQASQRRGVVPPGMRVYAIGDIHGQMPLLLHMHEAIQEDAAKFRGDSLKIVYLGDYVDRGSRSRDVLELMSARPIPRFERVYLRGNHEHLLLSAFKDDGMAPGWLFNGGDATLRSYGIYPPHGLQAYQCIPDLMAQFRQAIPQHHLDFLRSLKPYHIEDGYLFVHAGIRPGIEPPEQAVEDLIWIREGFLDYEGAHPHVVVHGHTPHERAEMEENRIGVDTGAFATGVLTALVLEGEDRRLLTVRGRPI